MFFVEAGFARTCQKLQTLCYLRKRTTIIFINFPKHPKHVDIDTLRLGIVGMFSKAKTLR